MSSSATTSTIPSGAKATDRQTFVKMFAVIFVGVFVLVCVLSLLRFMFWLLIEILILKNPQRVKHEISIFIENYIPCLSNYCWNLNDSNHGNNNHSNSNTNNNESDDNVHREEHTSKIKGMTLDQLMPGIICTKHDLQRWNTVVHKTTISNPALSQKDAVDDEDEEVVEEKDYNNKDNSEDNRSTDMLSVVQSNYCFIDPSTETSQLDMESGTSIPIQLPECSRDPNVVVCKKSTKHLDAMKNRGDLSCHYQTSNHDHDDSICIICSVCLQSIQVGDYVYITNRCYHLFHVSCIRQWVTSKSSNVAPSLSPLIAISSAILDNDNIDSNNINNNSSDDNNNEDANNHEQQQRDQQRVHSLEQQQGQEFTSSSGITRRNVDDIYLVNYYNTMNNIIVKHNCPNCRTSLSLF